MTEALLGDYLKNAESTLQAVPSQLELWALPEPGISGHQGLRPFPQSHVHTSPFQHSFLRWRASCRRDEERCSS